jgi:uncharacterized protein (TIGR03435 family)
MTQKPAAVLNQFLKEFGNPPERAIEDSRENLLNRFASPNVHLFEAVELPVTPVQPFRFAWTAGIVLAAVLVSMVVWRQGPRFAVAVKTGKADERSMSKALSQQAGEGLQVNVPPEVFDVVSVKLLSPDSEAFKRVKTSEEFGAALSGCSGGYAGPARIDPGRLTVGASSLVGLVRTAYAQPCKLVEGGPTWARSGEYYEINAIFPADTPSYTQQDLLNGRAPVLQRMLQNLLAARFRLVLKREFREMPVYVLTVSKSGKMKRSSQEEVLPAPANFPAFGQLTPQVRRGQIITVASFTGEVQMAGHAIAMSDLANNLRQHAARWVVDKTGLSDRFDIELKFASEVPLPSPPGFTPPPAPTTPAVPPLPLPALRTVLEELGLKLEPTRLPVEVLVIESVERPSEN